MNLRDKVNDMAERFSVGSLRTTAYNHDDFEVGTFDTDVDAEVEMTDGGGIQITVKVTVWQNSVGVEEEVVITVPAHEVIEPHLVGEHDDDQICWIKTKNV